MSHVSSARSDKAYLQLLNNNKIKMENPIFLSDNECFDILYRNLRKNYVKNLNHFIILFIPLRPIEGFRGDTHPYIKKEN